MTKSDISKAAAEGLSEMVVSRMPIYPSDQTGFGRTRPWEVSQNTVRSPASDHGLPAMSRVIGGSSDLMIRWSVGAVGDLRPH